MLTNQEILRAARRDGAFTELDSMRMGAFIDSILLVDSGAIEALEAAYGSARDTLAHEISDWRDEVYADFYKKDGDEANNYAECYLDGGSLDYHSGEIKENAEKILGRDLSADELDRLIESIAFGNTTGQCCFADTYWVMPGALFSVATPGDGSDFPLPKALVERVRDLCELRDAIAAICDDIQSEEDLLCAELEIFEECYSGSGFSTLLGHPQHWYFYVSVDEIREAIAEE